MNSEQSGFWKYSVARRVCSVVLLVIGVIRVIRVIRVGLFRADCACFLFSPFFPFFGL
jgi:hypothetical protein